MSVRKSKRNPNSLLQMRPGSSISSCKGLVTGCKVVCDSSAVQGSSEKWFPFATCSAAYGN